MPGAKVYSLPLKVAGSLGRLYFEEANCQSGLVRSARSETQSFKIPQYHISCSSLPLGDKFGEMQARAGAYAQRPLLLRPFCVETAAVNQTHLCFSLTL